MEFVRALFSKEFWSSIFTPPDESAQGANGSHGNVIVITSRQHWESTIFEANTNAKNVIVDFTATWCGPCRMIAPFFQDLSEKYLNLVFLKVDVDRLNDIALEFDVRAMPTFLVLKDGKPVDRIVGANKGELERKVSSFAATVLH